MYNEHMEKLMCLDLDDPNDIEKELDKLKDIGRFQDLWFHLFS